MTLNELLNNRIFDFPFEGTNYFPEHISTLLSEYVNLLQSIDDDNKDLINKDIDDIKKQCDLIDEIISLTFRGNSTAAYSKFSQLINYLEPHLLYPNKNYVESNPSHLFKARRYMDLDFKLNDMFHVPFEKRYDIKSSRFSLPGVPCLYLSNTIYTCWEELNRPVFSQMAVSRYEIKGKNFRFLDLENKTNYLRKAFSLEEIETKVKISTTNRNYLNEAAYLTLIRFLNIYPLIISCYVKVINKEAHFKPEYIFPQMLMQWIMTKEEIDGIKYFSTKCKQTHFDLHNLQELTNYAIPVRSFEKTGYCKTIAKSFDLTEPITWDLLSIIDPSKASVNIDIKADILEKFPTPPIFQIYLSNRSPVSYLNTAFGRLEHELFKMPLNNLNES